MLRIIERSRTTTTSRTCTRNFDIADDVHGSGRPDERRGGRPGAGVHAAGHRRAARTRWPTIAGEPVVLVFYPGDDTPVCTKQLNAYNDGLDQFAELGAQVLGDLGPGRRQPRAVLGQARLRLPAARRHRQGGRRRCTARSARSASRAAACSSSTATASIRYAHRAIAGLTYRPVSELVEALASSTDRRLSASTAGRRRRQSAGSPASVIDYPTNLCSSARADGTVRVLGIDPGLTRCGYAVARRPRPGARVGRLARRDPHAGRRSAAAAAGRAARRAGGAARRVPSPTPSPSSRSSSRSTCAPR